MRKISAFSLLFCWPQPCSQCLRVLNGLVRRHSPRWGDYDDTHTWRDAAWWWENRPEWVRAHHPDWWGDFDDTHYWRIRRSPRVAQRCIVDGARPASVRETSSRMDWRLRRQAPMARCEMVHGQGPRLHPGEASGLASAGASCAGPAARGRAAHPFTSAQSVNPSARTAASRTATGALAPAHRAAPGDAEPAQ